MRVVTSKEKFDVAYSVATLCLILYVLIPYISVRYSNTLKNIPSEIRVHSVCTAKETCQKYSVVRNECALAFNIEKCIDTRMIGKMYFMCSPDGRSSWSEDLIEPNYLTCKVDDAFTWIKSVR